MMREKSRLPPSPQSRHAKKPLISLETARTYSLDRMKKQEKPMSSFQSLGKAYAHSSQKQNQSPNAFCLNTDNSIQYKKKEESPRCINHISRKALAMSWKNTTQYYCFECSLYEARRGIKIIQIQTQPEQQPQTSISPNFRSKALHHYIHESNKLQSTLTSLSNSLKSLLATYTHKFSLLINQQQHQMQALIKSIQQQTHEKIKQIRIKSAQQNEIIMRHYQQIMNVKSVIKLNRLDVIKNYQDCVHGFAEAQFRQVMGSYWRQIEDYGVSFGEGVVERVGMECEVQYKEMVDLVGIRNGNDFTFSKQHSYQSPKCYQKLEGVPIISSNYYTGKSVENNQTPQAYHLNKNKTYTSKN